MDRTSELTHLILTYTTHVIDTNRCDNEPGETCEVLLNQKDQRGQVTRLHAWAILRSKKPIMHHVSVRVLMERLIYRCTDR